jgi:hypothetical protein
MLDAVQSPAKYPMSDAESDLAYDPNSNKDCEYLDRWRNRRTSLLRPAFHSRK